MGFSGGGSNILKPHTHDGTISQDGGSLDMDNVTQAALTSGDIVYSDGVHLQRLPIGSPSDSLSVSGSSLPQWGAGASGNWEVLGSTTTTVLQNDITISFSAVTVTDISRIVVIYNGQGAGSNTTSIQVNGITSANWSRDGWQVYGGTSQVLNDSAKSSCDIGSWQSGDENIGVISLSANRVTEKIQLVSQWSGNLGSITCSGYLNVAGQTSISEIKMHTQAGQNLQIGTNVTVYRQNVV
jgi:hypothetical protein